MSEWWTYRPSDFLLFSARTYRRLFELYNTEVWPAQGLALALGLALGVALLQRRHWAPRAACLLLGAAWLWVAWAFHWQRFSGINWAAPWFAAAFAVEGLLWWANAVSDTRLPPAAAPRLRQQVGVALLVAALGLHPALGPVLGRPLLQIEVFGIAPDPTVLASFGVLLVLQGGRAVTWVLWPIPLLWSAVSGLMLATMQSPDAWLLPAAAVLAFALAVSGRFRTAR